MYDSINGLGSINVVINGPTGPLMAEPFKCVDRATMKLQLCKKFLQVYFYKQAVLNSQ